MLWLARPAATSDSSINLVPTYKDFSVLSHIFQNNSSSTMADLLPSIASDEEIDLKVPDEEDDSVGGDEVDRSFEFGGVLVSFGNIASLFDVLCNSGFLANPRPPVSYIVREKTVVISKYKRLMMVGLSNRRWIKAKPMVLLAWTLLP